MANLWQGGQPEIYTAVLSVEEWHQCHSDKARHEVVKAWNVRPRIFEGSDPGDRTLINYLISLETKRHHRLNYAFRRVHL